jgi:ATP-dependent RNA helicase RhlE
VHRIGRTARAGSAGIAISFCDPSERAYLRDIERLVKRQIAVVTHDLPAAGLAPANTIEERRRPQERNYRNPKRRWRPRGTRRAA